MVKNWHIKGRTYKIADFESNDVLPKKHKELFPPLLGEG